MVDAAAAVPSDAHVAASASAVATTSKPPSPPPADQVAHGRPLSIIESVSSASSEDEPAAAAVSNRRSTPPRRTSPPSAFRQHRSAAHRRTSHDLRQQVHALFDRHALHAEPVAADSGRTGTQHEAQVLYEREEDAEDGPRKEQDEAQEVTVPIRALPELLAEYERSHGRPLMDPELRPQLDQIIAQQPELPLKATDLVGLIRALEAASESSAPEADNAPVAVAPGTSGGAVSSASGDAKARSEGASEHTRDAPASDPPSSGPFSGDSGRDVGDGSFDDSSDDSMDSSSSSSSSAGGVIPTASTPTRSRNSSAATSRLAHADQGQPFPRSSFEQADMTVVMHASQAERTAKSSSSPSSHGRRKTSSDPADSPFLKRTANVETGRERRVSHHREADAASGTGAEGREVLKGKGKARGPPSSWVRPRPQALSRSRRVSDASSVSQEAWSEGGGVDQDGRPMFSRRGVSGPVPRSSDSGSSPPLPPFPRSASSGRSFPHTASPEAREFTSEWVEGMHDARQPASWEYAVDSRARGSSSRGGSPRLDDAGFQSFGAVYPTFSYEDPSASASGVRIARHGGGGRSSRRASSSAAEDHEELLDRLESMRKLVADRDAKHEEVASQQEQMIADLQREVDELKRELAQRKREDKERNARMQGDQDQITALEAELNKTTAALAALRQQCTSLKVDYEGQIAETERQRSRNAELVESLVQLRQEESNWIESEAQWSEDRAGYRASVARLNEQVAELEARNAELDALRSESMTLRESIERLSAELEEARRASSLAGDFNHERAASASMSLSRRLGSELAKYMDAEGRMDLGEDGGGEDDGGEQGADDSGDTMFGADDVGDQSTESIVETIIRRRRRGAHRSSAAVSFAEAGSQTTEELEQESDAVTTPTEDARGDPSKQLPNAAETSTSSASGSDVLVEPPSYTEALHPLVANGRDEARLRRRRASANVSTSSADTVSTVRGADGEDPDEDALRAADAAAACDSSSSDASRTTLDTKAAEEAYATLKQRLGIRCSVYEHLLHDAGTRPRNRLPLPSLGLFKGMGGGGGGGGGDTQHLWTPAMFFVASYVFVLECWTYVLRHVLAPALEATAARWLPARWRESVRTRVAARGSSSASPPSPWWLRWTPRDEVGWLWLLSAALFGMGVAAGGMLSTTSPVSLASLSSTRGGGYHRYGVGPVGSRGGGGSGSVASAWLEDPREWAISNSLGVGLVPPGLVDWLSDGGGGGAGALSSTAEGDAAVPAAAAARRMWVVPT